MEPSIDEVSIKEVIAAARAKWSSVAPLANYIEVEVTAESYHAGEPLIWTCTVSCMLFYKFYEAPTLRELKDKVQNGN